MSFNAVRKKKSRENFRIYSMLTIKVTASTKIPITTKMMKLMCSLKAVHLCLNVTLDIGLFFEQMISQRYPAGATNS